MAKLIIPVFPWIPCDKKLPDVIRETPCLVSCKEWDIFENQYGESEIRIVSYNPKEKSWNTKSDIKIEAWMPLPKPYIESRSQ